MGVTINNESTDQPDLGQTAALVTGGSNAFYWYQIFALDSAVVDVPEMLKHKKR